MSLDCKGVYLSDNIFQDNIGCPYVKGTVIVSCMPDKPNLSPLNSIYQNQPLQEELEAYMIGYFVSTNDVNSFNSLPGKKSRFTSLSAEEIDDLTAEIFSKFIDDIDLHKGIILIRIFF